MDRYKGWDISFQFLCPWTNIQVCRPVGPRSNLCLRNGLGSNFVPQKVMILIWFLHFSIVCAALMFLSRLDALREETDPLYTVSFRSSSPMPARLPLLMTYDVMSGHRVNIDTIALDNCDSHK